MEHQKVKNLQKNTLKYTKNLVEINGDFRGTYNNNSQIMLKTSVLKSSLWAYSDSFILETIAITGERTNAAVKQADKINKGVIFKHCALFANCISEINNTQINNAKDLDGVMLKYNLIEYGDNYSKAPRRLWQQYRDEPNHHIQMLI